MKNHYPSAEDIASGNLEPGQRLRYTQSDGSEVWAVVQSVDAGVPTVKLYLDSQSPAGEHSKGAVRAIAKGRKGDKGKLSAWDRADTRRGRPVLK